MIDARSVTTEFNTLFETLTSIAEKVDPVKLNLTLAAAAQALTGLGDKFGQSIVNGNAILDDINPQMPQIRHDIQQLAALGDIYANAAPDLFDSLNNAVITARTLQRQEAELDAALLAATGLGNTGEDIFRRGGPYLQRGRRRPGAHRPAARHLQPRDLLHHPQLLRRRTRGLRHGRRQRLLAENHDRADVGVGRHPDLRAAGTVATRDSSGWPEWSAGRRIPMSIRTICPG